MGYFSMISSIFPEKVYIFPYNIFTNYSAIFSLPQLLTYLTAYKTVSNMANIPPPSEGEHTIFNGSILNGSIFL